MKQYENCVLGPEIKEEYELGIREYDVFVFQDHAMTSGL